MLIVDSRAAAPCFSFAQGAPREANRSQAAFFAPSLRSSSRTRLSAVASTHSHCCAATSRNAPRFRVGCILLLAEVPAGSVSPPDRAALPGAPSSWGVRVSAPVWRHRPCRPAALWRCRGWRAHPRHSQEAFAPGAGMGHRGDMHGGHVAHIDSAEKEFRTARQRAVHHALHDQDRGRIVRSQHRAEDPDGIDDGQFGTAAFLRHEVPTPRVRPTS